MVKKSFPVFVPPMMANSVKEPFDSPDWIFEMKLDGYRAISIIERSGSARVWSRNGLTLEKKFPAISKALTHLELQFTILDGEIVRPTASGRNVICRECCEPRYEPDHAATHALVHSLAEDASS
jgi:ATP-dependent DNA ligase